MLRWLLIGVAAIGCGCYGSHPGDHTRDGGVDAMRTADATEGGLDSPWCRTDSGVEQCGIEGCPFLRCACHAFPPPTLEGLCMAPPGDIPLELTCQVDFGCGIEGQLCNDMGQTARGDEYRGNLCAEPNLCAEMLTRGYPHRCFYQDASPFEGSPIPEDPCPPSARPFVCGPACGECEAGRRCFGLSERSGLGFCLSVPFSEAGESCGVHGRLCAPEEGCLHFVPPVGVRVDPSGVTGRCLPEDRCRELEGTLPERFRCDPFG
jgi:hypothetical protein